MTAKIKAPLVAKSPFREAKTEPPTQEQRDALQAHITDLVHEVIANPQKAESGLAKRNQDVAPKADPAIDAICMACQGHCCKSGLAGHGFVDRASVAALLVERPGLSAIQAIDYYMARAHKEKIAGSCLFHGTQGCSLSRNIRSEVCLRYRCPAAKQFSRIAQKRTSEGALIIADDAGAYRNAVQIQNGVPVKVSLPTG